MSLDNIVVHGAMSDLHDDRLAKVLDVLASHNLTLNGEKCIFSAQAIEFVGFRLSAEGLRPLHSNVDAVLRLPEPARALVSRSGVILPGDDSILPAVPAPLFRDHCSAEGSPQTGRALVLDP